MSAVMHEDSLSSVLSDFARTMVTDFPIQRILDHLVVRIADIMPISAAGVTLISPGVAPQYVAASDAAALRFERLQTEIGQGPCIAAFQSGRPVAVPDLRTDDRFPQFTAAALTAGLAAVFTFPLRYQGGQLGALDLYRDVSGSLGVRDMSTAQTLADVVSAYLINAQAREEARLSTDRFRHGALHDSLTGLANRRLLLQRVDHAAARARRSSSDAVVLFVELGGLRFVNDGYGHRVGDALLVEVARRLSTLVRPGDTLARVSGDEFVFLYEDTDGIEDVHVLSGRAKAVFGAPFDTAVGQIRLNASIGVAFAGSGVQLGEQLIDDAGSAMYAAKRRYGTGCHVVDLRATLESQQRRNMTRELRQASENDQLDIAYQPVVRCSDGEVVGVEALLRWDRPGRGAVAPLSMIEVAERSDLINDVGRWVLRRACRDHARWLAAHPGLTLDLAVNVSTRQLMSLEFQDVVAEALAESGVDPHALILEITESSFIEDSDQAIRVLSELRAGGIRIALDDFGTGYSALSYLRRLPIHIVKIDQAFVAEIRQGPTGIAIVQAVTDLAHILGLTVTAEGIEDVGQHEEIKAIGCDRAQGFYYARPLDAAAISRLLSQVGSTLPSPQPISTPGRIADR